MPADVVAGLPGTTARSGSGSGSSSRATGLAGRTFQPTPNAREGRRNELHRHHVRRALRLAHDQEPVDQLDPIIGLEQASLHQTLVLDTAQPTGRDGWRGSHDVTTLYSAGGAGQPPGSDTGTSAREETSKNRRQPREGRAATKLPLIKVSPFWLTASSSPSTSFSAPCSSLRVTRPRQTTSSPGQARVAKRTL